MVFRTVSAIAVLLICFGTSGGEALAQYYPPARAYPPPQTYPPQGYYPRQGYRPLPPVVDDDADDDMVYDLEDRLLPPGATVEQQANKPPSPNGRYKSSGTYRDERQRGYRDLPPQEDYAPYYGVPGAIPPGPAVSAEQDWHDTMRSPPPVSPRSDWSGNIRSARDWIDARRRPAQYGRTPTRRTARDWREQGIGTAVPSHARRLSHQGTGGHDHRGYAEYLPLSRARRWQGAALRGRRWPRGLHLVGHRTSDEDGGVAGLDSAGRDDRTPALSAALYGWRRNQPARRARALSRQVRPIASTAPISRRPSAPSCPPAASG